MSERYGKCKPCRGENCFKCGGTGSSGDAILYVQSEQQKDWDRLGYRSGTTRAYSAHTERYLKMEEKSDESTRRTKLIDLACQAVHHALLMQKVKARCSSKKTKAELVPSIS